MTRVLYPLSLSVGRRSEQPKEIRPTTQQYITSDVLIGRHDPIVGACREKRRTPVCLTNTSPSCGINSTKNVSADEVIVIIFSSKGCGEELVQTVRTIFETQPYELILVSIKTNKRRAEKMLTALPAAKERIGLITAHA